MNDQRLTKNITLKNFKRQQKKDKIIEKIIKMINTHKNRPERFEKVNIVTHEPTNKKIKDAIREGRYYYNEILYHKNEKELPKPVVPTSLINDVIDYFHQANVFQHQGITRTNANIKEYFYIISKVFSKITERIKSCHACQLAHGRQQKNRGKRYKEICSQPFEAISCDLVGSLPITAGNRYILTIMDRFTRYTVAVPLQRQTAEVVAQAILDNWIYVYGAPKTILSDNGTQFASAVFRLIMKTIGTTQKFTTAYHPEANGMIERVHRYIKDKLAIKAVNQDLNYWKRDSWDKYIPAIIYSYNCGENKSTGYTPFKLLYGRRVELNLEIPGIEKMPKGINNDYDEYLINFINQLQLIRNESFAQQSKLRLKYLKEVNKDRKEFTYKVGDWVSKRTYHKGNKDKLLISSVAPYEIIRIGENGITFTLQDIKDQHEEKIHGKHLKKYNKDIKQDTEELRRELNLIQVCDEILGLKILNY